MVESMPFDGQRMIFSGFEALLDEGPQGKAGYVDGFVVPVPTANKEAYRQFAVEEHTDLSRVWGAAHRGDLG